MEASQNQRYEVPLLMTGPLVCASLEDRKTHTRRVVVPGRLKVRLPSQVVPEEIHPLLPRGEGARCGTYSAELNRYGAVSAHVGRDKKTRFGLKPGEFDFLCPYVEGRTSLVDSPHVPGQKVWRVVPSHEQRLWVRETWCEGYEGTRQPFLYRATYNGGAKHTWRPSIFMPRKACRLELIVLEVHLVLLQDITGHEVITEGIPPLRIHQPDVGRTGRGPLLDAFASGWDKINGKRAKGAYAWDKNPWVWDIHYKRATRLRGE